MDFDDLDDAIEQRLADGDTTGLGDLTFEKKDLKKFEGVLPEMTSSKNLWRTPLMGSANRAIRCRAFVFYGLGDEAMDFCNLAAFHNLAKNNWLDFAVHEWPGNGARAGEPLAEDLDALSTDAFEAIKPWLEQVKEGAEFEGAPFAFIGKSVGCQMMSDVAKKVLMTYGMVPCAVAVIDRASPQFPLLSEEGQQMLESTPEKVVEAFNYTKHNAKDANAIAAWARGLKIACETRDQFYHKYDCGMLHLKGSADAGALEQAKAKSKYKISTLEIKGTGEILRLPVDNSTTVNSILTSISSIFAYRPGTKIKAVNTDGKEIPAHKKAEDTMLIEGLEDFKNPRYPWPHPVAIIGAGFYAVKMGMHYHSRNNFNVVMFDRLDKCGGIAWHWSATKFSRCQTDFGAFNVWWGHEFNYTGDCAYGTAGGGRAIYTKAFKGPGSPIDGTVASGAGTGVDYHPVRHQILDSIRYAMEEYKLTDCCHFSSDVVDLKIVGGQDDERRWYELGVKSTADPPKPNKTVKASIVYHFPGAYDINRIVEYPGEDEFGGQIGYGMGNGQGGQFVWERDHEKYPMRNGRCAILGNGAFAVENVRSCAEQGANKVYIITRRKSLLCPRLPCWFCHLMPAPTPAGILLDAFKSMYACAGIEDPWSFYAVKAISPTDVAIRQSSRFGIGDVSFLLHAYGLFEYRVDTLQRCSYKTLHLTSGEKLENIGHICKALGLLGDARVDKLHAMTHRLDNMVNGDWRRIMTADATGMDAKRFSTFSAGPGAEGFCKKWYYIHQHPWEVYEAQSKPDWKLIPIHKASETQPDQPIYNTNVQYEMYAGVSLASNLPMSVRVNGDEASYKYGLISAMHPGDKFHEYCVADWNRYQDLIRKENGYGDHAWVEYPYTKDEVKSWYEIYKKQLNIPVHWDGPSEEFREHVTEMFKRNDGGLWLESVPRLLYETKLWPTAKDTDDVVSEAMLGALHGLKKDLTSSPADSSLDFGDEQLDTWKNYVTGDSQFKVEEMPAISKDVLWIRGMMGDFPAWDKVCEFIGKMKA